MVVVAVIFSFSLLGQKERVKKKKKKKKLLFFFSFLLNI
jgi:hypothetical protein